MNQKFKILGILVIVVGVSVLLYWFVDRRTSVKVANDFLTAVQNKDWGTVAKLIHPAEREKLGLTLEQTRRIGENLLLPLQQKLGAPSGLRLTENPFLPTPEEERLYFKNSHFFRILRGDKEGAIILVTKTEEGWRVNFSLFTYTVVAEAAEQGILPRQQIRPILWQSNIPQIFIGQESIPLPP
jgi:hypothetical protein